MKTETRLIFKIDLFTVGVSGNKTATIESFLCGLVSSSGTIGAYHWDVLAL